MTVPNSLLVTVPSPSLTKREGFLSQLVGHGFDASVHISEDERQVDCTQRWERCRVLTYTHKLTKMHDMHPKVHVESSRSPAISES